jgi:YidC/Oxa1 family membrane protein insertase
MFEPIAQVIDLLYRLTSSYGMAIILLTITVRLILFPLTAKQTRSMQGMAKLQPEIKKLQEQHGADRQKLNEEVMKLYKEHKVNPAGGCLPLLLQAPIFIGLYRVVNGLTRNIELSGLMVRVAHPDYLPNDSKLYRSLVSSGGQMRSFGIDLAQSAQGVSGSVWTRLPYIILVVLVGATGYLQQVIMNRQQGAAATPQAAQMQKIMKFLPVFFAFISFNIQAAVVLYWIVGNIWMIGQSQVLRKLHPADTSSASPVSTTITMPAPADTPVAGGKSDAKAGPKADAKAGPKADAKSAARSGTAGKVTKPGQGKGQPTSTGAAIKAAQQKSAAASSGAAPQSAIAAAKQAARQGRSNAKKSGR